MRAPLTRPWNTLAMQLAPAPLVQLSTGVPGLDEVLGGGIPEYSLSLIAGGPGTGKTTLAQQILFANTSTSRPGVYFTGAGQPARKLLNHLQQFTFFDDRRVDRSVHILNLGQRPCDDPSRLLETIERELDHRQPSVVAVDLLRALTPDTVWNQLVAFLARCEATTLLIADHDWLEPGVDPAPSTADTILRLTHSLDGEASVRTVQALKVRGQEPLPGVHNVRLTANGAQVFPRWPTPKVRARRAYPPMRLSSGLDAIDVVLGGGVPAGDAVLVEGPSGTGKSVLATHFIAQGGHQGEPGLAFLFEERPDRFVERAEAFGLDLARLIRGGLVEVLSFRGRDMSPDEVLAEMQRAVSEIGARRVVIDAVASLELVLTGRRGLHDCLWRLLDALTGAGVTVWLNSTPDPARGSLAPLVDDVLELQRVEQDARLENRLAVTKMRWSEHSTRLVAYEISHDGVYCGEVKPKPSAPGGCLFDVPPATIQTRAMEPLAAAS
jgi:circadian clock protein KaiC